MRSELLKIVKEMAQKEKKLKGFKRRIRVKGKLIKKSFNTSGNLKLLVKKGDDQYNFVVMKNHKDKFEMANKLKIGEIVYAQGINRFRAIICTQLRKTKTESIQETLGHYRN